MLILLKKLFLILILIYKLDIMGAKYVKGKDYDNLSALTVFEKSLSLDKNNNEQILKDNTIDEITNEIKQEVVLPREDECSDSQEIIFEKKDELKIKDFFENCEEKDSIPNLNQFYDEDIFNCKRGKSFVPKPVILKFPPLRNLSDNFPYPFRLSMKSYGIVPKWNEKPNKILFNYEKEHLDFKSCNDKIEYSYDYLLYADTEKTTPNLEDLQDLLSFRKKMIDFRSSINDSLPYNEYESILSCEDIIEDIQEEKKKKRHRSKKKSDWNRYVNYILKKKRNKSLSNYKNRKSEPFPHISKKFNNNDSLKESNEEEEDKKEDEDEDDDEEGFSILGMIERVSKEKKKKKNNSKL